MEPATPLIEKLKQLLATNEMVVLGDIHTKDNARKLVAALIESGMVKTLFIEFPNTRGRLGGLLNDWLRDALGKSGNPGQIAVQLDDQEFFDALSMHDAYPTLKNLAALAVSKKVRVLACDLSREDALEQIGYIRRKEREEQKRTGKEEGEDRSGSDQPSDHSLFSDDGLAVRDAFAAQKISEYSEGHLLGRLMLWGDNHFKSYEATYITPWKSDDGTKGSMIARALTNMAEQLKLQRYTANFRVFRNHMLDD